MDLWRWRDGRYGVGSVVEAVDYWLRWRTSMINTEAVGMGVFFKDFGLLINKI